MPFDIGEPRSWPELVFHVLAHVRASAHLAASAYDATYVAFVERYAGPAGSRPLGEDIALLGRALPQHEILAKAQLLALLYDDAHDALADAARELDELSAPPGVLNVLQTIRPAAELLRCAALLEEPILRQLPPVTTARSALEQELTAIEAASITVRSYPLVPVRSLRLRGRLFDREIWHGVPGVALQLEARHVAWQIAHEATVGEVLLHAAELGERDVEHAALVLMEQRAVACDLGTSHRSWLAHFGELPPVDRDALPPSSRALVDRLMANLTSSGADA